MMRYINGRPDYASLTPEEAAEELKKLDAPAIAADKSFAAWGGDYMAHLQAHTEHQDTLRKIAAKNIARSS